MRRNTGFSLIEILTVVAIMATLMAIIFPVLARVLDKSRQVSCVSNMKQLGLAAGMYAQDYDETLVPAGLRYAHTPLRCYECANDPACLVDDYWTGPHAWVDWGPVLQPYIKNERVFTEPARPEWGCWGYAMNTDSSDDDFPGPPTPPGAFVEAGLPPVKTAQVSVPAECLFLYDSHDVALEDTPSMKPLESLGPDTEAWETMNAWVQAARSGMPVQEAAERAGIHDPWRHSGGFSVVWLDGHVSWKRLTQLRQGNLNIAHQEYSTLE